MIADSFVHLFAPEFVAALVSGAVVLGAGYYLIDRRLSLRERADRDEASDRARSELQRSALGIVEMELKSNAGHLRVWRQTLERPTGFPFPGFDVNGWTLVVQADVLASLRPTTIHQLMGVYNRMRSANDQLDQVADLTAGPSAMGVAAAIANATEAQGQLPGPVAELRDRFVQHLADIRAALADRLDNLKPVLDEAIDAVEQDNGTYEGVPAAQRHFSRDENPTRDRWIERPLPADQRDQREE